MLQCHYFTETKTWHNNSAAVCVATSHTRRPYHALPYSAIFSSAHVSIIIEGPSTALTETTCLYSHDLTTYLTEYRIGDYSIQNTVAEKTNPIISSEGPLFLNQDYSGQHYLFMSC